VAQALAHEGALSMPAQIQPPSPRASAQPFRGTGHYPTSEQFPVGGGWTVCKREQEQASERMRVPLYINSDEPDLLECLPGVTRQLVPLIAHTQH
jgi:hypothetical protein